MESRSVLLSVLAGTVLLCGTARAQDRPENPHGPLPAGLDCSACHTPEGWRTLKATLAFDHAKASGFALTGMHTTTKCAGCHLDLRFDTPHVAQGACASCHVDVHQGRIAGACERCHDTRSFHEVPAIALHARAGFALTGAHLDAPCESCHRNDRAGAFTAVPEQCIACHREAFAAALMPNHVAAGFPTDCQECHASVTWTGAAFDHATAANGFSLVGAHASLRCETCHMPPNMAVRFTATSQNDCISCHQAQFNQAHGAGSGFPTTCADCHSVNSWSGADFNHSQFFPLSGAHDVSCATCHTTQGDFTQFTCLTCHGQSATAQQHQGVSGYTYDSHACYTCHRNGGGGGD